MIDFTGLNSIKSSNTVNNSLSTGFRYKNFNQKPDTFSHANLTTCPIGFTGKSNRLNEYKKLTEDLNQTANHAQTSLNNQLSTEGWTGKTADAISVLWNSKNRAVLVQSDIDAFKEQVTTLDNSIKDDKFKDKFKEIFDVEYDHSNIVRYNKKAKQLETALTADCIAKFADEKLSKNIEIYNKLSGDLKDLNEYKTNNFVASGTMPYYNHLTTKDEIFENMENSLASVLGDKKILDDILSASGLKDSSKEDKYKVYGHLANVILESSKTSAKNSLKGETLEQIKTDYDKSYAKAFGTNNDIVARVDKYNASQKVGAACVRFVTGVVLNTLGPSSVLANCVYSVATSVAMDIADAKTKKVDRDINLKTLAINAGLNGACGAINQSIVNKYSGSVASKILANESYSKNMSSVLTDFVVKEIVSKEGVKLPAYAVEGIVKYVIQSMAGVQPTEETTGLSQKELDKLMPIISETIKNHN